MTLQVVRPLGLSERIFMSISNITEVINVLVGNKIRFRSSAAPVDISSWKTSQEWSQLLLGPLTWMLDQNPNLSVVVNNHKSALPSFLRLESIDIAKQIKVFPIKSSTDINIQIENGNNTIFNFDDKTTPLWNLVVCPIEDEPSSFYFFFVAHHVIVDGVSCMVLAEQLVERLNVQSKDIAASALDPSRSTLVPITSQKPYTEPLENLVSCTPSTLTLAKLIGWEILPQFVKRFIEPKYWSGDVTHLGNLSSICETELLQLSAEETIQIIKAAKQHSTTVTAILYAASMFALKKTFLPHSEKVVIAGTAVNIRELIPNHIPRSDQGIYAGMAQKSYIDIKDGDEFWALAADYGKHISYVKSTPGVRDMLENLGVVLMGPKEDGGLEKMLLKMSSGLQNGRSMSIVHSNIGVGWNQAIKDQHEFLVENGLFSANSPALLTGFSVLTTTANKRMTISIIWHKASYGNGRERFKVFANEIKRVILEATEKGKDQVLYSSDKEQLSELSDLHM
ncbi:hypothetical protein BGZ76_010359 [Entomortierella beljakovae]|nr:hypothetical protein BGZ76_010359 [Entomortierella beljakovae]